MASSLMSIFGLLFLLTIMTPGSAQGIIPPVPGLPVFGVIATGSLCSNTSNCPPLINATVSMNGPGIVPLVQNVIGNLGAYNLVRNTTTGTITNVNSLVNNASQVTVTANVPTLGTAGANITVPATPVLIPGQNILVMVTRTIFNQ